MFLKKQILELTLLKAMAKEYNKPQKPKKRNGKMVLTKEMSPILYIITVTRQVIILITTQSQKISCYFNFYVGND